MHKKLSLLIAILSVAALAQQPAAVSIKTYASSADVAALAAKAKAARKDQPLMVERILALAPYNANLEYRASVGTASVHEKEAEMFYVIDGSATLITGGKLKDEKRTNAENLSGSGIEGGTAQNVAKGDFVIVPENTGHWFSVINGSITLMSIHMPRPLPMGH